MFILVSVDMLMPVSVDNDDSGECRYMVSVSVADKQQTAELQTRKWPP